jgi:hypothetical protein
MHAARLLAWGVLIATVAGATEAGAVVTGKTASPAPRVSSSPRRVTSATQLDRLQSRALRPARVQGVDNSQFIDVNNIKMFLTNTGSFAWDKTSGNAGLEFPKGTGKTCVFAAGLWMGGQVGGQTRVVVSEYSDEYGPGAMIGAAPDDPTKAEYKVYKLYRDYADAATRDVALADYNTGAVIHGAPAVTVQPDGSLNILGDEMMWSVYNDADPANHTNRAGTTNPLGLEVQQTTFAFNRQGALGNVIFISYRIINKGGNTINNMFVSQWSDPDDGYAGDDLVGCDTTLSVGFVYNGTNNDNIYGAQVPSVGYDFFQGPKVAGAPLPMKSFNGYTNGTDPDNFTKTYNLMQGLQADGSPRINPVTGQPTTFMFSGDPVLGSGWLDTNTPQDVRLQLSSGPFTMAPGDTQVVVTAIVVGQSKNRFASISQMKFFDSQAQAAFDVGFNLPAPPKSPIVKALPSNGGVRLTWDQSSESYKQPPYVWEGYVVYQGASIAGPWTRIATYDIVDGITTVLDNDFNEEQGLILPTGKAFGTDSGLQYTLDLTQDAVRGGPLHTGTTYYYSVDAYSVGLGQTPQVLESAFNPLPIVPQTPAGGIDYASATTTPVVQGAYAPYTPSLPPGTDDIQPNVVDPSRTINADYKVGYKPDPTGTLMWYLVRTVGTQVDTVLNNQTNFSGDANYAVIDGLQPKVVGTPLGLLAKCTFTPATAGTPAPFMGDPDVGGAFFGGSADYAANILPTGSAIAAGDVATTIPVEIDFTGPLGVNQVAGQNAYRYLRTQDPSGGRIYQWQDYVPVPFTVWDLSGGGRRQLNCGFLENQGNPVTAPTTNHDYSDSRWDPDNLPDFNGFPGDDREFIAVYTSSYSATPSATYEGDWLVIGPNLDIIYGFWPNTTDSVNAPVHAGDKVNFFLSSRSTNDYFTFSSKAANQFNAALAKDQLNQVLAVPNPYFNHSSYELNQFARVVKFTHLPAVCTVRLFNLAGDLVRTLQKNDNTSQLTWDLLTDRGLPVASGIYIFHVDAPSVGTKVGKVAIFMEKERLNTY